MLTGTEGLSFEIVFFIMATLYMAVYHSDLVDRKRV
jgi:hypothetical protein